MAAAPMLEQPLEWPVHGPDHTVPDYDSSAFYPVEDLFHYNFIYTADAGQQALQGSPRLSQGPSSETQGAAAQRGYTPYMTVQHPVVRRPIPRYPPGYNHNVDHLPLVGGFGSTHDESTTNTTPALTGSHSESIHSPFPEVIFMYASGSLQYGEISHQPQPPLEIQATYYSTQFSSGTPGEDGFALRNVREAQAQASGYCQPPGIHIVEYSTPVTYVVPLRFSRERYSALLQAHGPMPSEIKIPSDRNPYSFAVLERRGCYPVISITETGGELSDIAIDLNGQIATLTRDSFCRVPGCGYWSKTPGRVPRHRLTHFKDRGFSCQNPIRRGADAPKHLQCQLRSGQYVTRLDLFKKHCRAQSCKIYAPSFAQDLQRNLWYGPENVDELYLLPLARDVHVPFVLKAPKS